MQTSVLTLAVDHPIRDAVEILEDAGVHAAPVADAAGRIVGLLSLTDVARTEHVADDGVHAAPGERELVAFSSEDVDEGRAASLPDREDYSRELLGRLTVGDWMTPRIVAVRPDATLPEVCRVLDAEGIHRVLVMDDGRLHGILSTMDIVRHLGRGG